MNFQSVLTTQQQQYALQQQRRSGTPSRGTASSSPAGGSSMNIGGSTSSPSGTAGSFVHKLRQAPGKASSNNIANSNGSSQLQPQQQDNNSSSTTGGTHPSRGGSSVLTQARKDSTMSNASTATNGSNSSVDGSGKWVVNDRRLAQWQQQPFNLSPATHLNLEPMLPPPRPDMKNRPLLVLDVDETLVHASFTSAKPFHVKITIHVDGESGDIFVAYRPHLFTFLDAILPLFEVAIFTASQSCYADQLMDAIDPQGRLGRLRLFREHCTEVNGARVKDLSLLGRPLHRIALIDNSPVTYLFQPRNAIPILSWFDDPKDTELLKLLPMLRQLAQAPSAYDVLDLWNCSQR